MPQITAGRPLCTVIVTLDADANVMDDLIVHARLGVESEFARCSGFIGGALHISHDGRRLVQYLQWESEAAYIRCRDDPKWHAFPSTDRFAEHVSAGRATVDARIYRVLADCDTDSQG